ncbi:putative rac serine-threonine kinase putativeprotein kinase [Leptomonas pyrrhocoris]|uniref:Putative rac serine-threonine kinase putativeprotein kinase n=2 Tax=Leptomonas pyrrhocoris TaxID=157538 RepID=A0A0M9G609_LEPPY|nr:putative rac serine-threonine kinase putativeprotein kinase [Leptomonas pyrrhocoris]KPA83077.1 putative rac serine-threonine kinase putativeprotein kinase [Leptomonas pyrrhocoris]|eukprot:XP_015661516.1 putative rac serine-threonine kinase putativeprotein kinase [Leptomonas pyrrhocoris]
MSGYLKVLSRDGTWETQYAVVDGAKLQYWRRKEDTAAGAAPVKELDLQCATLREIGEPCTWSVQPDKAHATYLQAESEQRKDDWVNALRHYNSSATVAPKVCLNDFERVFVLGKGSYGKVYMVRKKDTGKTYAMKEMSAEKMKQAEIKTPLMERLILQEIDHPFIVHLHYSFQEGGYLYMILDLLGGGELFTYIENRAPLPEETGKYYAAEVATALGYLHSRNIIYRDLKPENVVFDQDGHACLTDFGLAKSNVHEENAVTYCGTNEYLAPELLKGVPHGKAVDWWSLGLMMCEMIFNELPFYDDNPVQMQTRILTEEVRFPKLKTPVSEPTKDLIRRLLEKDPKRRLQTLEEFKQHPCYADLDFDLLLQRQIPPPITPDSDPAHNFAPEFTNEVILPKEAPSQAVVMLAGYTYDKDSKEHEQACESARTLQLKKSTSGTANSTNSTSNNGSSRGSPAAANSKRLSLGNASNSSSTSGTAKQTSASAQGRKSENASSLKASPLGVRKNLIGGSTAHKPGK